MIKLYFWIILFSLGVFAQIKEDALYRSISSPLKECYENKYLLEKDNRLPHTLNTFIALLRKIEDVSNMTLDLRTLTVGILHRFRQDGIEKNPAVVEQDGVLPYRKSGQSQKNVVINRFIPDRLIPNHDSYNMLTDVERCTLHFMLSSSIEIFERMDENTVCRYTDNAYRSARSVTKIHPKTNFDVHDDVETLTPEQMDIITSNKNGDTENEFYPNALYPELPPNHPKIARFTLPKKSNCPVENGVIKTTWGPVSAGPLIAGLAAGLQPEVVKLSDVFTEETDMERMANLSKLSVDNRWIATIAGDLAEVTLWQGPASNKISIGANGNWNSSSMPRWYFLKSNENLQFTTAEVRGDIDGFVLANEIEKLYSKVSRLKLSQVLDLYYSSRGLFSPSLRACNRKALFQELKPSIMSEQAYTASLVLAEYLRRATINDNKMKEFALESTDELAHYVDSMKDLTCQQAEAEILNDITQAVIDLTIILDTTWPFDTIQPIIATILDKISINRYNSQYTIINGYNGNLMINTTNSILNFGHYNASHYANVNNSGFDLPKALEKLSSMQKKKLNDERYDLGNAKSDVVLIIPYTSTLSGVDKELCINKIKYMQEQVPDARVLILTHGSVERWTELVLNPLTDLYSTTTGDIGGSTTIAKLISRIKQVPQRLINTQCGANYEATQSTNSFNGYIEPGTIAHYRMHPNYFFSHDSDHVSKIKIQGHGWGNLKVCTSRQFNVTSNCEEISDKDHSVTFNCEEASFIHLCDSLHLTIIAINNNSSVTNFRCTEPQDTCRFPHMIKYTVSYENLLCGSSANINVMNIFFLIVTMIYTFL
ncbi:hypothetical protein PUN28_018225 [Cardiocondyla obscurior]|uniref:Uncharacterized protein n=1 Tax=Cardiocondyla obscurior TaxID=286306 RepID=A0AAW2EHF9_9HYME